MNQRHFRSTWAWGAMLALLGGSLGLTCGNLAAADAPAKPQSAALAGWQKVVARKGGCIMYVPADWKVDSLVKGSAGLDDNSVSAVVSFTDGMSTLAEVKPVMQGMFKPTKTFEDSAQRLWYQYTNAGRTGYYVGLPVKGGICGAQISFKPGKETIADKVAASIAAGS